MALTPLEFSNLESISTVSMGAICVFVALNKSFVFIEIAQIVN